MLVGEHGMQRRNVTSLPSSGPTPGIATALAPVSNRVAELLTPTRTVPRYGDHGFDGVDEVWEPRTVDVADLPDLRRQLALVEDALTPMPVARLLARIHTLLSQYRGAELPAQVEAAIAEDWLDDLGEFPEFVVTEACRQWRRHPSKHKFKPLPGDIRLMCEDIVGRLPVLADRLRRLLASVPSSASETAASRADDIRNRVIALAAAKRIQS